MERPKRAKRVVACRNVWELWVAEGCETLRSLANPICCGEKPRIGGRLTHSQGSGAVNPSGPNVDAGFVKVRPVRKASESVMDPSGISSRRSALFQRRFGCRLQSFQLRLEFRFGVGGHAVDKKDSIQMIDFMLHGAAQKPTSPKGVFLTF